MTRPAAIPTETRARQVTDQYLNDCRTNGKRPSGSIHESRRRLYTGLGGARFHGRVMFTSFEGSGGLARTASGCCR